MYDFLGIIADILRDKNSFNENIIEVFYLYFRYSTPIIVDIFNTKGLKNSKRHMKKVDKIFIDGMVDILDRYESSLENFLNNVEL